MFRFAKLDGSNFNLDEVGEIDIAAFDSGNDIVAICLVNPRQLEPDFTPLNLKDLMEGHYTEEQLDNWSGGNPEDIDDWDIIIKMSNKKARYLCYAIVSAYNAIKLCEYIRQT